jgi:hypothetical protein
VGHAGGGRNLDVMSRQPGMLDVDPEPVEVTSHPQVMDDVVMKHPPYREHHQSLTTLETVFHQLGHGSLLLFTSWRLGWGKDDPR